MPRAARICPAALGGSGADDRVVHVRRRHPDADARAPGIAVARHAGHLLHQQRHGRRGQLSHDLGGREHAPRRRERDREPHDRPPAVERPQRDRAAPPDLRRRRGPAVAWLRDQHLRLSIRSGEWKRERQAGAPRLRLPRGAEVSGFVQRGLRGLRLPLRGGDTAAGPLRHQDARVAAGRVHAGGAAELCDPGRGGRGRMGAARLPRLLQQLRGLVRAGGDVQRIPRLAAAARARTGRS